MEEDRISQLPDELLQHILSLIDINQSVQTSILATRWKNLWRSVSDLHFHFHLTAAAAHSGAALEEYHSAEAFSHRFISNFLSHRHAAAPIRTFHLSLDSKVFQDGEFVEQCLLYAVSHGVESLRLHASCSPTLTLPAALFASTTLRELDLRQPCGVDVVGRFSLPHLKSLHLEGAVLFDDEHFKACSKEPFSGFPELERLSVNWLPRSGVVLRAPKLRFLEIFHDCLFCDGMEEISAPLLTSFRYQGYLPLECSKVNLPMLEEVYLNVHRKVNEKGMEVKCVVMLQQLGNAKIVALTLDTLKVLEMDRDLIEQSPPPFPYMKCLKLMKGHREIPTVLHSVMKYLTVGILNYESLVVAFPADGAVVVEEASEDFFEDFDDYSDLFD